MLPSSKRVSRTLFEKTMNKSTSFHSPYFSVKIAATEGPSRFSFVVSKKIDKRATKRNALRRKGYTATEKIQREIKPGFVVLVFAKKSAETLGGLAVEAELKQLFQKAGVL
jgi:ribonuclease P protein component